MKIYGIKNCNTVKKALDWLKEKQVNIEFHDYKKLGITEPQLQQWCTAVGWQKLVNKKGSTWRSLSVEEQNSIVDEGSAIALMLKKTSVIKRPLIEHKHQIIIGFDEKEYSDTLL